ncbi:thiamine phosphate synthase [Sphingomicrobium marinum]|uniref:thiamine phosphate synthase n=1 Tax=Sphingomicrobium marinum TaxID=1227950 RepID=UPI002240DF9A|nr:thiamine phosphate synthase [Sphingomicrobium marinum]
MLPRQTLFTDERIGDALLPAIERLPAGSGVVFRHKRLAAEERATLARKVAGICTRRALILSVSEDVALARSVGAAYIHKPTSDPDGMRFTLPVHNQDEAAQARRSGAAIVYVSPVFPSNSHPGGQALGIEAAHDLARISGCPAIALGGMDQARFEAFGRDLFVGWAGIDALLRGAPRT